MESKTKICMILLKTSTDGPLAELNWLLLGKFDLTSNLDYQRASKK